MSCAAFRLHPRGGIAPRTFCPVPSWRISFALSASQHEWNSNVLPSSNVTGTRASLRLSAAPKMDSSGGTLATLSATVACAIDLCKILAGMVFNLPFLFLCNHLVQVILCSTLFILLPYSSPFLRSFLPSFLRSFLCSPRQGSLFLFSFFFFSFFFFSAIALYFFFLLPKNLNFKLKLRLKFKVRRRDEEEKRRRRRRRREEQKEETKATEGQGQGQGQGDRH